MQMGVGFATAVSMLALSSPVQASAETTTSVEILRGKVFTSSGQPAWGTKVRLIAWPSNDTMETMAVGDTFNLQEVAVAYVDQDGKYSFNIGSESVLDPFKDGAGIVNVDVSAGPDSAPDALTALSLGVDASGSPAPIASGAAAPSIVLGQMGESDAEREARLQDSPPEPTAFDKSCVSQYAANLGNRTALVGMHYSPSTSGWYHEFDYNSGASTTFGVGYSATGAFGSWKQSGTHSRSTSTTVGFPGTGANRHDYTYFAWGKYKVSCYIEGNFLSSYYQARVRAFAGGASTWSGPPTPSVLSSSYCVPFVAGSWVRRTGSKAYTAGGGADVSGVLGIDLSATSGYSSAANIYFKNNSRGTRNLCGTHDVPGSGSPRRLVGR